MAISCISPPISRSVIRSFPNDLFLLSDFKAFVNGLVGQTEIPSRFRPRLYTYADFILVKLYALICNRSIDWAAELLNEACLRHYRRRFQLAPRQFSDKVRFRRLIPHQTDVDKFFRLITEEEVHFIFGNCLTALSNRIRKKCIGGSEMKLMVDNTEYAYYGKPQPPYDIGTRKQQGTKRCHLFQGLNLHGCGMTLFTEFRLLRKGQYRAKHIGIWCEWMRKLGFRVNTALMDREFYRASLVKELKSRHFRVLIPAKKYPRVRKAIAAFLAGTGALITEYFFSQKIGAKPYPSSVHVSLVVVGHKNQSAAEIRRKYRQKVLSYDQALKKLSAFFTTIPSWKNHVRWAIFLTRLYKKRWNEETGFRMLNFIHSRFRPHQATVHLANLYLRGILFNNWQFFRKIHHQKGISHSYISIQAYFDRLKGVVEEMLLKSVNKNLRYLMKRKRRLVFEE